MFTNLHHDGISYQVGKLKIYPDNTFEYKYALKEEKNMGGKVFLRPLEHAEEGEFLRMLARTAKEANELHRGLIKDDPILDPDTILLADHGQFIPAKNEMEHAA